MRYLKQHLVRTLMLIALPAVWTACGGLQQQTVPPQSIPLQDAAKSRGDLLYVSDIFSANVYVLSYPAGRLVQTLTGFSSPNGLCVDRSGDVFITDQAGQIVEYAHGGTSPIKTLGDKQYPIACSVDPTTGNLAVADESKNVSVYPNASGGPTTYSIPFVPVFCAYDDSGDLFADSSGAPGVPIAELQKGGSTFQIVHYNKPNRGEPAGLQWDGYHLAVGTASTYQRQCCGRIYRFTIRGLHGKPAGSMHLLGGLASFFIDGSTAVVATGFKNIALYHYPEGDRPTRVIKERFQSYSLVVSHAPSNR
ncbi:MAG: hypothetical protein JO113_09150 [Candidatus Eremiobacteraeota bacterium]|nr:hypothetical protein [Candidatus Eremiobacteraeota bacterium]